MAQDKRRRASRSGREDQPEEDEADEAMKEQEAAAKKRAGPQKSGREPAQVQADRGTACSVIGVGASAGGLEALRGLLVHLPEEPPMALVIVRHRVSGRTGVMKSLLEKHTAFAVVDIEDGMEIKPKTAYLAPADKDVSILHGSLYLGASRPHPGAHRPVDAFLHTLARDQAKRAIAIILSGTGSDGALGVEEIKAAGGMVMVQRQEQAKDDSTTPSAIDTGMVDFVLPVEEMGRQLARHIRPPFLKARKAPDVETKLEDQLRKIFMLIRNGTGHDFSHYKRSTIQRRIARRLAVHQIEDLDDYVRLLQESPGEVHTLAREMLITVTNFFRDPEAFDALSEQAIRPLVEQRPPDVPIRVWVPACATGEEAYSIAILLQEAMDVARRRCNVQIFATDLDGQSIETARRGQYAKSIAADVSPERLKRHFTEENNHYKIKSAIREMLVFARHDLIKDAPFPWLDLISCRNVLIYMDATLQKRLIPMFHSTLNRNGFLFLGESESIGTFADLFSPADSKHKVFKRKPVETGYEPEMKIACYEPPEGTRERGREPVVPRDLSKAAGGWPTFNILNMARPEIHHKLRMLQVKRQNEAAGRIVPPLEDITDRRQGGTSA